MNWKIFVSVVLSSFFTSETLGAALGGSQQPSLFCGYEPITTSGMNEFSMMNKPHDRKDLTYKTTVYSDKVTRSNVDDVVARAFDAWADVADLTFTKINRGTPDVEISFVEGDHGDGHPFDGRGNVLGHATTGFVHFDDSENWSTQLNRRFINLYAIAVHEIGHSLGLGHSDIKRTIMYRSYDPSNVVMALHSDDIDGIQSLYGAKPSSGNKNKNKNDDNPVAAGGGNDCWTTGCQLNSWAVVGCEQYARVERSKTTCRGGYMYECCTGNSVRKNPQNEPATGSNSGSWQECWTTGCQLNSWAVVGCNQYGMTQVDKFRCSGGHMYKCCK